MATVNLGAIKFNWKGAFNNSTAYAVDDVVSSGGSSYVCILASQGNAVSNGTYWNQMSSAGTNGTNGTDLTSTLTTRGDIVYKGASALTRLPKGTAGYYLKQGANDPEWGEASSGEMVKIATGSFSNVSTLTLDGTAKWGANNTYAMHKLVFYNYNPASDSNLQIRQTNDGSVVTGAIYSSVVTQRNCSNTNQALISQNESDHFRLTYDNLRNGTKHNFHIDIYNMMVTDNVANLGITSHIGVVNQDGDTRLLSHIFAGATQTGGANNTNRTGLLIYQSGGNITGNYAIYGIKR